LERLSERGVDRIYGYPGDGMNGILGTPARAEDRFEFIQVPHEEVATFIRSERRQS
jgi:pyruvate dehydrogenase (quinone)